MLELESVVVRASGERINFDLSGFYVDVVGSRAVEEGYELVLEGEWSEVTSLLVEWQEAGLIVNN